MKSDNLPYTPDRLLGDGRFSEVHHAKGPKGPVALKRARLTPMAADGKTNEIYGADILAFHTGSVGPMAIEPNTVVKEEAAVLKELTHPSFVKLLDQGEVKGRVFMALEYIEGQTFRAAIEAGKAKLAQLRRVIEALKAKPGFIHGDLKPDNIIIDPKGSVRIIDPSSGSWVKDKRMLLTPLYNPAYRWSDAPALGLMMAEILTGKQLLAWADQSKPPRPITPALGAWLSVREATGTLGLTRAFLHMSLPRELVPTIDEKTQALILRCLGLHWDGEKLDSVEAVSDLAELERSLPG